MDVDDNPRMLLLAREVREMMDAEPNQDIRFAVLAINLAEEVSQIRIEDRERCKRDIGAMIDKYSTVFAVRR